MVRRERAPRPDDDIINHPSDMALLAAVAQGLVQRADGSKTMGAAHLLEGRPVQGDLRRLRADELIRLPMSGPPTIDARGEQLLDRLREAKARSARAE
jgi:hypothetical protein